MPLNARERLLAALHLRRLRRLRAEALDEALLSRDLASLARGGLRLLVQALGLLALIVRVVPGVRLDLRVSQLNDAVRDTVEEVAVVRHDEQRASIGGEVFPEPVARGGIEVVRGLVEQHVVRPPHQHLRQRDAHAPATGELAAALRPIIRVEAETRQHAADALLDAVAIEAVELLEQRALLLDQRVEIAVPTLDLRGHLVEAGLHGDRLRERLPQLVEQRVFVVEAGVLPQVAEGAATAVPRRAALGRLEAGDDPQQRRLPGAVRADEPGVLAVAHDERNLVEDIERTEGLGEGVGVEHRSPA